MLFALRGCVDCRELATQFFEFVFCFGGFAVPSFYPYVFPLYDQHILRVYLHCTLYKFFLYTPLCERGVFMHFWFPLHGMLIYQYTSYSGLPSYWFSSCLLLFSPLTCMGFMGYLAVLFLPPSGLETVYFCLLLVGWDQHCSFVSDVLFLGIRWFGLRFVGTDAVIPVGLCYHSWRNIYIYFFCIDYL